MRSLLFIITFVALASGCGKEIGDSCVTDTDCNPSGVYGGVATNWTCDLTAKDGYCTIMGCDYNTCPHEAVCVRFFTGQFENQPCDPRTEGVSTFACSADELCDLQGDCVTRTSESRYCMRKCNNNGDCRSGYECRDLTKMTEHGGEDVLAPGVSPLDNPPKFCALAPTA